MARGAEEGAWHRKVRTVQGCFDAGQETANEALKTSISLTLEPDSFERLKRVQNDSSSHIIFNMNVKFATL
jgi:hypothetical protein